MAPWTRCTRHWSCCSGGTTCGLTSCSVAATSRPCATRPTCTAWPCPPSTAICRPSTGERRPALPRPTGARRGPPRYSICRFSSGTTPARRRPRSSRCSLVGTTRHPTTCRSCPTAGGWRPTSTTSVGFPRGVFPSSRLPCLGSAVTSRAPVSSRLRGCCAVSRSEDWRHLWHLQVTRLPERYGWTERAWLSG